MVAALLRGKIGQPPRMGSSIALHSKKALEVCALVSGIAGEAPNTFELVMTRRMHARLVNGPGDLPMSPELSWQKQPVGEEYCTRGPSRLGRSDKSALGRRRCLEPWNKSRKCAEPWRHALFGLPSGGAMFGSDDVLRAHIFTESQFGGHRA